jgi:small subunit ribosomal protein S4
MRYTGPKNRLARRVGLDLGLKTAGSKAQGRLLKRINIMPGQHGLRRKKTTDYGAQLNEKQKLKFIFGISEAHLKRYFLSSTKMTGNTALFLSRFLEKRLDNIVYRLGFAPTRSAARQLVSHRHIKVNGKVVSIPSYQVRVGDVISLAKEKTANIPAVRQMLENKDLIYPDWLEKKGTGGKLVKEPTGDEIEKQVNLRLIIEYYSR